MDKVKLKEEDMHIELNSAIDNVNNALYRIEALYNRIAGTTSDETENCDSTRPTLNSVLENGSPKLRQTTREIIEMVENIENKIF